MKQRVMLFSLLPILAFAIVLVTFLKPFSVNAASAVTAQHVQIHAHILGPKQYSHKKPGNNLTYHHGSIMGGTTKVYAIFWEPTGSFVSASYNSLILQYFGDVGSSSLYHNNTQYKDSKGNFPSTSTLAGSWVDIASYPSSTLSDTQVQIEVTNAQNANGWTSSPDNVFFVFTAKNENICINASTCSFQVFCGYHSFFGTDTIYAAIPYTGTSLSGCGVPASPNSDIDADSTINITSHEQMEAATDPLLNAWYDRSGNEIGDKCVWMFGPLNAGGGDVTWNGHSYELQKEWDNKVKGCVLTGP